MFLMFKAWPRLQLFLSSAQTRQDMAGLGLQMVVGLGPVHGGPHGRVWAGSQHHGGLHRVGDPGLHQAGRDAIRSREALAFLPRPSPEGEQSCGLSFPPWSDLGPKKFNVCSKSSSVAPVTSAWSQGGRKPVSLLKVLGFC